MARNVLSRLGNIVKAEIEDVLGQIENPRKMVNQMLIDMERAFDLAVGEVSRAIANEKIIERRLKRAEGEVERLQAEAEDAVNGGDDETARRVLDEKVSLESAAAELKRTYTEAESVSSRLKSQLAELKTKLETARNRKDTIAVRKQFSRATSAPSRLDRRPFDEFDRLCNDVDREEIASEVYEEISGVKTEDDLDKIERNQKVKAELENLKRRANQEAG